MTVIDDAIYVDGRRVATPAGLQDTFEALQEHGGFAWIGLYRPDAAELGIVAEEFQLHPLAVEDALKGHQRAKLDHFGETLFVVLRPARYLDETEKVEFGEVHTFIGEDFLVAVRHAESPNLALVRARLEAAPELLSHGPLGVFYAIIDEVVDRYQPVLQGLEDDVDEIEQQLFSDQAGTVAKRIYDLSGEVMDFQRATKPLIALIEAIRVDLGRRHGDPSALELRRSFRDVLDHVLRVVEKTEELKQNLQNALSVNATLVAQRQNDAMKKISGWAAIIFAPTLISGIYGMNFVRMPELHFLWGYPAALLVMLAFAVFLYVMFKKRSWL
ncbi:MAG TPA: magnesium/cobalt transporter CorA [Microbacterium sp.]|uniref:magnesium/cobalt transporter CorA n=1 Tax=Microbacterium sp. TaxID=51671 RepID=UPI002B483569|nr:magnesium/cobalt transporter CorA [Microbacterium sp.]HKT55543.1 magnesium/cobalt transporter CorA [Microbacterium sp.]